MTEKAAKEALVRTDRHPDRARDRSCPGAPPDVPSATAARFTRLAGMALAEMGVRLPSAWLLEPIAHVIADLTGPQTDADE